MSDTWLANDGDPRPPTREMLSVLDQLVGARAGTGAVRADISAIDVVMMVKGVCEAARQFQHLGEETLGRQLDLVLRGDQHRRGRAAAARPAADGRGPRAGDDLRRLRRRVWRRATALLTGGRQPPAQRRFAAPLDGVIWDVVTRRR